MRVLMIQDRNFDPVFYTDTCDRLTLGELLEKSGRPHTFSWTTLALPVQVLDSLDDLNIVDYTVRSLRPTTDQEVERYINAFDRLWDLGEEID